MIEMNDPTHTHLPIELLHFLSHSMYACETWPFVFKKRNALTATAVCDEDGKMVK